MLEVLKARIHQKYRTIAYPDGPAPELSDRFAGKPLVRPGLCGRLQCARCLEICPTGAIELGTDSDPLIDMGKCLFCRKCEQVCPSGAIQFSPEYRLCAATRDELIVGPDSKDLSPAFNATAGRLFKRSFKLRQVCAGGCGACEADANVLGTPAWDMERFGIQFVASPRHADGLLITGPVTENMRLALEKTYEAVPAPKVVIAVGACAISGGAYADHPQQCNGASAIVPVDLFVPGCPPHPLTLLNALLRFICRIPESGNSG
ncbi:MAG: NADH-quinone oxidoreductase subunit NuoB [Desulfobacterales bacterium]|jgi:Ni,Fe-hydrogenase III small subunit/formate hydrogenlyase subunit 6/NADH:ubiquinone oxidoreductase subunit I|nr:NADH-quinone oxidoreductase subunit NuoB [Desulfobacterales bacterium]MDD3082307.1 NADH-quinone oxidoreductase subunit NuoB [Desulfobacterales bacterium]MDD3950986.1 NADH-quinone oxidoreductase subunit NuoB [Desulfobacterales bacterium]MDD4462975.1 NADH-quinone oxidoreductase subunit NuoB [Desulfobacterales bacterium]MDY0378355.1 NADH-quinone oxidoreductase subunit NuoB [Desulfobacterales bacterium]